MKNSEAILAILQQYLKENPTIRFGQALFNLNINQFYGSPDAYGNKTEYGHVLRDIYNDTDETILKRMKT